MEDLKILCAYFKEHKKGVVVIIVATIAGAALGAAAYFNGWLG